MYIFKLYIFGQTLNQRKGFKDLHEFLQRALGQNFSLEVIDLFKTPHRAEEDQVFATPTFVKCQPEPRKKLVGDLSDRKAVLQALGIGMEGG